MASSAWLSPEALAQWHTAVEYQFYHGLGMLLVAALAERLVRWRHALRMPALFLLGVLLFSGSLYLLSTRELTGLGGQLPSYRSDHPIGRPCSSCWLGYTVDNRIARN